MHWHGVGQVLLSLLLTALLMAPSARSLPSNGSDSTKDSNRPSLELSFTNKLVKSEVNGKNQELRANGTVGSATRDTTPFSTGAPVLPQGANTKENSTTKAPPADVASSTPATNPRTTTWLPYYFSSESIARAAPSFSLDQEAIREGDATPSRGRSGSPRRIDNFPPLQNQPGEEYLDAINRRTVVPPPPVVSTTPMAITTAKTTTPGASSIQETVAPPVEVSDTGSVSSLAFDATTVDSDPDIGTAFSLSEDFTQGFLGFPVSETITDADLRVKISVPTGDNDTEPPSDVPSNSTSAAVVAPKAHPAEDNFIETTLKPSSASPPVVTPSPPSVAKPSPPPVTKSSPPPVTKSSPPPVTKPSPPPVTKPSSPPVTKPSPPPVAKASPPPKDQTTTVKVDNSTDGAAAIAKSEAATTSTTTTTTTTMKPMTRRPNPRRRLPSFRATSPRPTIRRRLPGPPTTTETVFTRPTTVAAVEPEPDLPVAVEASEIEPESPPSKPFAAPVEPTTTRREYIMTVPPLLDFDNVARDDAASDDDHADASLEATHLTSVGGSGGGIIPEGATSAIIISAIIGGCAILFFAVLMVFCMWRQHVSRRPIYPPPESSNSSSTSSTAFHSKLG